MKIASFLFCAVMFQTLSAQQGASLDFISPKSDNKIALYGIGNLNTEALSNINASGKFSGAFSLFQDKDDKKKMTIYLSANRNASNNDSTLATTLLFPEIGKASFIGTLNYMFETKDGQQEHYVGPFLQGTIKTINGKRLLKSTNRDTTAFFSILDWELGVRYLKEVTDECRVSGAVFMNLYNVPNEDNNDYRLIFNEMNVPSHFWALGIKLNAEVNRVQMFADFRHVFGNENKMPYRDIRGFNVNIGFLFNADVFTK